MSLINEMLRDLEARRPDELLKQNLQREIRSLPVISTGSWRWLKWLFAAIFLIGGVALWLQLTGQLTQHFAPPAVAQLPVTPVVQIPPTPVTEPVTAPVIETAAVDSVPQGNSERLQQVTRALEFVLLPVGDSMRIPDPLLASGPAAGPVGKVEPGKVEPGKVEPGKVEPGKVEPGKLASDSPKAAVPGLSGPIKVDKSLVLATPGDRADAEYRKAETAVTAGRIDEALALLRGALIIDPTHVQIRQALLRLLLGQRKQAEAMAVLNDGLAISPEQIGWAISLARLQLEQGELIAADHSLTNSQSFAKSNADYAGFQGHLKSRLGEHRQAVAYYLSASRLAPAEGRWWLGLGLALEAEGKVEDAEEAFRRGLASGNLPAELSAMAKQRLH